MPYVKEKYGQTFGKKDSYFEADHTIKIVPSPIGGWDAISPLAVMEPKYAAAITNWVPRPGWVELRGGYNAWCQGITTSPVETVMAYRAPQSGGTQKLFAASGSQIWDVSNQGAAVLAQSGLSSDQFQYVNFTPAGGSSYLLAVNGINPGIYEFNGTSWSNVSISGTGSGVFIQINIHKRRVWLIPPNSTGIYFLGTDAIAGSGTLLDLGAFMSRGGYLVAMATWTVDGGNGPDDMAVFISSQGQVIIYKGTDPTNANAWALVGVFDMAIPIGRRCFFRLGADVILITQQGLIPLSQALPFDPSASRSVALTNRIQNAILLAAQNYLGNFGWQFISFPQQGLFLLNIPQVQNSTQVQYVQNAQTGAWTQFTGWNANCFEVFNNNLYFGDNKGNVNIAYTAGLDLVSPILADVQCAFNYLDEPGRLKNATMVRPFLVADGTLTPTMQIDVDFGTATVSSPVTILTPAGAIWDTSLWDSSIWSLGTAPVINWLSCVGFGTALALRMIVNLAGGSQSATVQSSVFDSGVFDTMLFDGNGGSVSGQGVPTLRINSFELSIEYGGPI